MSLLPVVDPSTFYTARDASSWSQHRTTTTARRRRVVGGDLWLEFSRQASAFACADGMPRSDVMCFAYCPADQSATYRYVVSTLSDFWRKYSGLPDESRTFYELIREDHVANLYFDLEFKFAEQPNVSLSGARALVDALKAHVAALLRTSVNYFTDLESCTSDKFSAHLVLRAPTVCFTSAVAVGAWVRQLVLDAPEFAFFVDQGVYTRNRLFRLAFSTKLGRAAPLVLAPTHCGAAFRDDEAVFLASLVTNVAATATPVDVPLLHAPSSSQPRSGGSQQQQRTAGRSSPFPAIDRFIAQSHVVQPNGFVRSTLYFAVSRTLVLEIGGRRFCARIGREHKHNHVYVVADLVRLVFTQRCHDPECRAFRSNEFPIDAELDPFRSSDDVTDEELLELIEQTGV